MVAAGNRVLLRRGDDSLVGYTKLRHFVATSFVCGVDICTSIHRPNDDVLLSFSFLLDGVKKLSCRPIWDGLVAVGYFSAKVKGPEGWHVTPLKVLVARPVCWSDLTLKEDELGCTKCRPMK